MVRKNLPAAELKRALIEAGLELLRERGVSSGLERVTLKDAIERSGVPRSSAYLLLGQDRSPLEQFHLEVLQHLDEPSGGELDGHTVKVVLGVLEERDHQMSSGDPVQMATALREVIRQALQANIEETSAKTDWRIYVASLAASGTGTAPDMEVVEMHHRAGQYYTGRFIPLYNEIMRMCGLRVKHPMTVEELASASTAMTDGVALRAQLDPHLSTIKRETGPGGALEVWNSAAVAFEGFCLSWLEPDPDAEVSADLSTWISF